MNMSPRRFSFIALASFAVGGVSAYLPQLMANVPQAIANPLASTTPPIELAQRGGDGSMAPGDRGGRRDRGGPDGGMGLLRDLNLTPEQTARMETIRETYRPQLEQQRTAVRSAHESLDRLMAGEASDAQLRTQHQALLAAKQRMDEIRFNSMLEMRSVLTVEQRQEVAQRMAQRREGRQNWGDGEGRMRGGDRRGPGGPGGGPGGPGGGPGM
jgi:protein CpxP